MSQWSDEEKQTLLQALYQYGPSNIGALQQALPDKTATEIQLKCEDHTKLALRQQTAKGPSIRRWLQIIKRLRGTQNGQIVDIIPRVFKYIALFEKRAKSTQVDLRACYLALYHMSLGLVAEDLDETTDYYMYECLTKLASCLKYGETRSYKRHLASLLHLKDLHKYRSYSNSRAVSSLSLNPLGIPEALLTLNNVDLRS